MIRIKNAIVLLGDAVVLYAALILTLILRYGLTSLNEQLAVHLKPFSLIFIIWLLVFYLTDLYKDKNFRISPAVIQIFLLAILISATASAILFYLFPNFFQLTPKTNLAIFSLVFCLLDFAWRFILVKIYISSGWRNRLLIIGESPAIGELISFLKINPQVGYDALAQIKNYEEQKTEQEISQIIASHKINTIIIQTRLKKDHKFNKIFYQLLSSKIAIIDFVAFYEMVFQKLPLDELEESWFVEKIATRRHLYDIIKRAIDVCLSFILIILTSPISLIIVILTKFSSRQGPVIYRQERIGTNNKPFILFKFGVMRVDEGSPWTLKNDERFTRLGKFLDYTHLNEIPQLYNILRGDISFIGPRPESKELVELYRQLPYYEVRHLIKPGVTGWAQLNYKASTSLEEAREKLEYDIYYVKNRSLILDFMILLKTVRLLFLNGK